MNTNDYDKLINRFPPVQLKVEEILAKYISEEISKQIDKDIKKTKIKT